MVLIDVPDQITRSILDAGCGTGENAIFFAWRGCQITCIDFLDEPISRAKRKAERGRQAGSCGHSLHGLHPSGCFGML
jgi:2-polyprenyl-3-methyl-5-hydroxy-6-metoxy-1,4-benzoquinol methylase